MPNKLNFITLLWPLVHTAFKASKQQCKGEKQACAACEHSALIRPTSFPQDCTTHYSLFGTLANSAHNTIRICTKLLLLALYGTAHWCAALNGVNVLSAVHTNCVMVGFCNMASVTGFRFNGETCTTMPNFQLLGISWEAICCD